MEPAHVSTSPSFKRPIKAEEEEEGPELKRSRVDGSLEVGREDLFLKVMVTVRPILLHLLKEKLIPEETFRACMGEFNGSELSAELIKEKCQSILRRIWPEAKSCELEQFPEQARFAAQQRNFIPQQFTVYLLSEKGRTISQEEFIKLRSACSFFKGLAESQLDNFKQGKLVLSVRLEIFNSFLAIVQGKLAEQLSWNDWVEVFKLSDEWGFEKPQVVIDLLHEGMIEPNPQGLADFLVSQEELIPLFAFDAKKNLQELWMQGRDRLIFAYLKTRMGDLAGYIAAIQAFEQTDCVAWMKMNHLATPMLEGIEARIKLSNLIPQPKHDKPWFQGFQERIIGDNIKIISVEEGIWISSDGYFIGTKKDQAPWNGKGKKTNFEGEWREGKRWNGKGEVRYANGSDFEGEWREGKRWNGKGRQIDASGSDFEGEWREGKWWTGTCKEIKSDGSHFEGELREGKWWTGRGKRIYANDSYFEGELKGGELWSGKGLRRSSTGEVAELEYKEGRIVKGL